MFSFLYEMMGGEHEELPRRKVTGGISWDPTLGTFVADESVPHNDEWLGRGQLPGTVSQDAPAPNDGSVADEIRQLAQKPR